MRLEYATTLELLFELSLRTTSPVIPELINIEYEFQADKLRRFGKPRTQRNRVNYHPAWRKPTRRPKATRTEAA